MGAPRKLRLRDYESLKLGRTFPNPSSAQTPSPPQRSSGTNAFIDDCCEFVLCRWQVRHITGHVSPVENIQRPVRILRRRSLIRQCEPKDRAPRSRSPSRPSCGDARRPRWHRWRRSLQATLRCPGIPDACSGRSFRAARSGASLTIRARRALAFKERVQRRVERTWTLLRFLVRAKSAASSAADSPQATQRIFSFVVRRGFSNLSTAGHPSGMLQCYSFAGVWSGRVVLPVLQSCRLVEVSHRLCRGIHAGLPVWCGPEVRY